MRPDYRKSRRYFYFELWNPASRQHNVIDSPPGVYFGLAYGFGYVPSLDDYKIICSFGIVLERNNVFCGLYVFSLRPGKWKKKFGGYNYSARYTTWRRIRNYSDEDRRKEEIVTKLKDKGFWNEGIVYWTPNQLSLTDSITAFDLTTEELKEYRSMDWQHGYCFVELFGLRKCLALRGRKVDRMSEFWVLKDSDDWGSWELLFSVCADNIPLNTISETGMCLSQQSKIFKLVDLSEEALESSNRDWPFEDDKKGFDYVESLVSPFRMPD